MSFEDASSLRRDPVTQYLHQKHQYGKENSKAEDSIEILADTSRAYFPTQQCSAKFRVNEELFAKGCSELKAEFRGEIHSYAIVSNGQTTYVSTATNYLFSYEVQLFNSKSEHNPPSGANSDSSISFQEANPSGSTREWIVNSTIPEMGNVKHRQVPLPPTFRDHRRAGNGTNYISYAWKLTAEMKGITKRNKRFWLPILVLPLSYSQNQMAVNAGPSLHQELPDYGDRAASSTNGLPEGWKFQRVESRIKKGLIFSRGRIELKISSPPVSSVSMTSPLPFLLSIKVSSSDKADLDPNSETSILPKLPWSGAGEAHPKFEIRRKDVSKGSAGVCKTHSTAEIDVEWSDGHVQGSVAQLGREAQDSRFKDILALASPWSKPSRETSASEARDVISSYPNEKKLSGKEVDDSDTDSVSSDEDEDTKRSFFSKLKFSSKGKGKEKDQDHESNQDYSTTATISGFLPTFFTPAVSVHYLKTSYTLRLRWKCKGMGNDLHIPFKALDLDSLQSGVSLRDVSEFSSNPEALSDRSLGFKASWLKDGNGDQDGMIDNTLERGVDALQIQDGNLPGYTD